MRITIKGVKRKAIPITDHGGLWGSEMLRIPHCLRNWLTDGGEVVTLTHKKRSTPHTHFLLPSLVLISVRG
jgi:hypothetical protein